MDHMDSGNYIKRKLGQNGRWKYGKFRKMESENIEIENGNG